jgi:hypothetical protein
MAEFPRTPDDAMFPDDAIAEAFRKHRTGELLDALRGRPRVLGIDVAASSEGDENVIASALGGHVEEIIAWREADTMRSVARIETYLRQRNVQRRRHQGVAMANRLREAGMGALVDGASGDPVALAGRSTVIRIDEIGVGRGAADRLREMGYAVSAFNASKRPEREDGILKFQNQRAEAFDRFRSMMVRGQVALPYSDELQEELRTCRAFTNGMGKLQIISKEDWKVLIGRSPDRLDAVVMSTAGSGDLTLYPMRAPRVAAGIAL